MLVVVVVVVVLVVGLVEESWGEVATTTRMGGDEWCGDTGGCWRTHRLDVGTVKSEWRGVPTEAKDDDDTAPPPEGWLEV